MKVLAIYCSPQECGETTLDFVELEHAAVVKTISLEGLWPELEHKYWEEPTGKFSSFTVGFVRANEVDQYKVGQKIEEGIIRKSKISKDTLFPDKNYFDASLTVEHLEAKSECCYNEELDTFGKYLKSIGIDIPWNSPERQELQNLIPMIGKALGFEIVNILYYS